MIKLIKNIIYYERNVLRHVFLLFFTILISTSFFLSCNRTSATISTENLQNQIDSLEKLNTNQASELKEITQFMDVVSSSLDSISELEQILLAPNKEGKMLTKAELRANLNEFASLIERQRNRISQLEDSLSGRDKSIGSLRNIIAYLGQQLDEKNLTIANLEASLNGKNVDIQRLRKQNSSLTTTNDQLRNVIKEQGEALTTQSSIINECYFIMGTKKELQQAGILTSGNLLSKAKLNVSNFSNANFSKVDITQFLELVIPSKKVQILTQMPKSSYSLIQNASQSTLTITDPTSFWSVSNYLVIQIK